MNIVLVSGTGAEAIEERLLRSQLPITSLTHVRPFLIGEVQAADLWIVPVTPEPLDIDKCQETVARLQDFGVLSNHIMVVKILREITQDMAQLS